MKKTLLVFAHFITCASVHFLNSAEDSSRRRQCQMVRSERGVNFTTQEAPSQCLVSLSECLTSFIPPMNLSEEGGDLNEADEDDASGVEDEDDDESIEEEEEEEARDKSDDDDETDIDVVSKVNLNEEIEKGVAAKNQQGQSKFAAIFCMLGRMCQRSTKSRRRKRYRRGANLR